MRCQTPPEERPAQQPQQPALQQTLQRHAQESRQRSAARRGLARQEREAARAEARSQKRAQREAEQAAHKAEAAARAEVEARTLRATYMGDLPSLAHTGAAVVVRAQDGASVTIRVAGAEATIPTASILEVSLAQGSRVTSRRLLGRAGGAIVGDLVTGPVGALVGGMATRRQQQVATQDDSAVLVRVETAPGRTATVVFKGAMGSGALAIYAKGAAVLAPTAVAVER